MTRDDLGNPIGVAICDIPATSLSHFQIIMGVQTTAFSSLTIWMHVSASGIPACVPDRSALGLAKRLITTASRHSSTASMLTSINRNPTTTAGTQTGLCLSRQDLSIATYQAIHLRINRPVSRS
jgi:hypothetical protein